MERKGSLLSFRPDIKVLDATLRDGGLCNNFAFSDEFAKALYKMNLAAGVDYMEMGYKASGAMFDPAKFGKYKFCAEEDIRKIVGDNKTEMKLSVMARQVVVQPICPMVFPEVPKYMFDHLESVCLKSGTLRKTDDDWEEEELFLRY